jgi:ribonuclease HI
VSKFKTKIDATRNEIENRDTFYIPLKDVNNLSQQTFLNNFYITKFEGTDEIWVWTDGSLKTINNNTYSGFGVFYSKNSNFNFHSVSTYKFENTNNELEAIRFALMQTPFQYNGFNFTLRIFTDSKASVDLVNNFPTWNSKKQLQCENKEILRHIQDIISNIKENGGIVKFELVPSHVLDDNTHQLKVNLKENKMKRVNSIIEKFDSKTYDILLGNERADMLAKAGAKMNKNKVPMVCFPYKTDNYFLTHKGKYVWGAIHRKIGKIMRKKLVSNHKCLVNKNNQNQIDFKTSSYIINKNLLNESLDNFPFWINLRNFQTKIRSRALALRGEIFSRKSKKTYRYKGKYNSPLCIFCHKQGIQNKIENTFHFLNDCCYSYRLRQQTISIINDQMLWYSNGKVEKLFPFFFTNIPAVSTYKNLSSQQLHLLQKTETFDSKLGNCLFFPKALYQLIKSFYKENKKSDDNKWKPSPRSFANFLMIELTKQFSRMYQARNKGFHKFNKETFKEVDVFYKQGFNTNISNTNKRNLIHSQIDLETDIPSRGKYRKAIDGVCNLPKRTLSSKSSSEHEEVEIRLVHNKKSKNKKRKTEKYSVDKVQLFNQNTGLT